MKLDYSPQADAFRAEIRHWFETEYPRDILDKHGRGATLTTEDVRRSEMALGAKGWLAPAWPEEYGGPGWTFEQQYIFDEELERAGVPTVTPMGVIYVGPVIYTFGSDDQKQRWLPGIVDGSIGWAQGYSEPEAGSDLASLQFKAERTANGYRLNGTKIWTSAAQHADWIFLLTRTDNSGRKQEGITFICAPMSDPGIVVHPIITIDGKHFLNRVEFTDVEVPEDHRIGEEGRGWQYSQFLLGFERTSYARIGGKRKQLRELREIANNLPAGGNRRLIDDEAFARKLGEAELRVDVLHMTLMRVISAANNGAVGKEASILKILATETAQDISTLYLEAAAAHAQSGFEDSVTPDWAAASGDVPAFAAPGVSNYFGARAQTIYGGTNEIQKTIIAKHILGL